MRYNFRKNTFEDLNSDTNKIAISGSDKDIKWRELSEIVVKLITELHALNIPKGHPVVIYGHKESLMPVAILSLIKAEIPYIPVDVIYPDERIEKIRSITGSQVVINLSKRKLSVKFAVEIDSNLKIIKNSIPDFQNSVYYYKNDPLAYIMFTSGSTGEPKGVKIHRSNIFSFLEWIEKDYPFDQHDVFMNQSPFTFDVSLYDILSSFMLGGTVILISKELASNPQLLFSKLKDYKCTVWTSTPSFAYLYLRESNFNSDYLKNLKMFLFAGEVIPTRTIKILEERFPKTKIINAYGPTEATITTTWIEITTELIEKYNSVPIGYPKRDSEILIDNESSDPSEIGEIIIVGDHVSSGYFKQEELSGKKFTFHNNKKAFRTGDLGFIKDDIVFFTGRSDDLIKFHGYRIELGEIDSVIRNLDNIDNAITIPLKRGDEIKRLISMVILQDNYQITDQKLKEQIINQIKDKIPGYMIPGDIIAIDKFPVNANHKIDKIKLVEIYMIRKSQ